MNRRVFISSGLGDASLWSALMPPSLRAARSLLSSPQGVDEGIVVRAGDDRFQKRRRVLGDLEIDIKVSSQDTGGRLLIIEHCDPHAGGPPRHIHTGQDEWFYVLEGRYALEIGGSGIRFILGTQRWHRRAFRTCGLISETTTDV